MWRAEGNPRLERFRLSPLTERLRETLQRPVPANITALHYLGALIVFFLLLQAGTGLLLMFYYYPSAESAYGTIAIVTDEVRLGWLVRSLHYWGAELLILLALLHMIRVYFSQAYQAPRQLSWFSGAVLLLVFVGFDITGSLLPWDQVAYWSNDGIRETVASVPLLGSLLLPLLWGGSEFGGDALLRFYAFHVGLLPWIVFFLLSFHLLIVWYLGIKEPSPVMGHSRKADYSMPFLPDLVLNVLVIFLLTFGALLTVAVLVPPTIAPPADPVVRFADARPPWYLIPGQQLVASLSYRTASFVIFFLVLFLLAIPILDPGPARSVKTKVFRWALGLVVVVVWVLLGVQGYRS
jgi:quinol-cytochrome oxidoreductase complex cytochrome b subunit